LWKYDVTAALANQPAICQDFHFLKPQTINAIRAPPGMTAALMRFASAALSAA
jgi:hypothetical protein